MALSECPAAAASTIWLRRATCRGVPKADNHCCSCCCSVSWIGKAGVARGMRSTVAQAAYVVNLFVGHIARLFLGHYTSFTSKCAKNSAHSRLLSALAFKSLQPCRLPIEVIEVNCCSYTFEG